MLHIGVLNMKLLNKPMYIYINDIIYLVFPFPIAANAAVFCRIVYLKKNDSCGIVVLRVSVLTHPHICISNDIYIIIYIYTNIILLISYALKRHT